MSASPEIRQPGEMIALARARRSFELGRLPGWSAAPAPLFWQRLREHDGRAGGVSSGTLVALLRQAARQRQMGVAKDIFVALLERTEAGNAFWVRRTAKRMASLSLATP